MGFSPHSQDAAQAVIVFNCGQLNQVEITRMKTFLSLVTARSGAKKISSGLVLAVALLHQDALASPIEVNLGTASSFSVLAGSGITVAGAAGSTTIAGDIGTTPTPSITGLQNVVLNGVNHANDAVTALAKGDFSIAYNDAAGRASDVTYALGFDLVGQ